MSVEAVRRFKPHPATYAYALEHLGASPAETFMVAAHAWDIAGAQAAGLRGAWVARGEAVYPPVLTAPEIAAPTLLDAAEAINSTC